VIWLIVALVTWPLLALVAGLALGRGMSAANARIPRISPTSWLRRELPRDIVAPMPKDREAPSI
jgi:hypothetical protein